MYYKPLIGASIFVRDSGIGKNRGNSAIAREDGTFILNAPVGFEVTVSMIGCQSVTFIVKDEISFDDFSEGDTPFLVSEGIEITRQEEYSANDSHSSNTIVLKKWDANESYIKILQKYDDPERLYKQYLEIRDGYYMLPQFYIDVADLLHKKGDSKRALKLLGNLVEISNENSEMIKNYAQKLIEYGNYPLAIRAFEYLVILRPEHPQSLRDLALALEASGEVQRAFDLFYSIMIRKWSRFDNIKPIVFSEINSLISRHKSELDISQIDSRLIYDMPVDTRIVISWGTDNCDIDLHIKEPTLEECSYKHKLTLNGGRISDDFTRGFGPEEYMIKKSVKGTYVISVNYYASQIQKLVLPTYVYADLYTDYGTQKQKHERIVIRLEAQGNKAEIGRIETL